MSEAEALQNAVRGQYAAGTVLGKLANAYREEPDVAQTRRSRHSLLAS